MCNKPNEVETSVRDQAWREKQHASKSRGKKRSRNAVERLPEQIKELDRPKELDRRTNFINTAFISGQCSRDEAASLYDWYFGVTPGAAERIEEIYQVALVDEMEEAYFSFLESRDNPYRPF